jgi:hypothetical protein
VPLALRSRWKKESRIQLIEEIHMFDGKNNRLLDSFAFRLALLAGILALWSGAGYLLLALA